MRALCFAVVLSVPSLSLVAHAGPPAGWFLAGKDPAAYECSRDTVVARAGAASARLASTRPSDSFGTMMQSVDAAAYLGKRMRLTGHVKTRDVAGWAGLWMRVDDKGSPPRSLAFDNMQSRALKGTLDWTECSVVLDVANEASSLHFGVLLSGEGSLWLSGVKLEAVPTTVPSTSTMGKNLNRKPENLDFAR